MVRCDEVTPKPLSEGEIREWLGLGSLPAEAVGIPSDLHLGGLSWTQLISIRSWLDDIRVLQFAMARVAHRPTYTKYNMVVRATLKVDPRLWVDAHEPLRKVARTVLRAIETMKAHWVVDSLARDVNRIKLFLHRFRFHDPDTLLVVDGRSRLRCYECGTSVKCILGVLAELSIERLPAALDLSRWATELLVRSVWRGHNVALQRSLASATKGDMLPWWVDDVPEGVEPSSLLGSEHHPITPRRLHRVTQALLAKPNELFTLLRGRPPSARPTELRTQMTGVLRARDPCDQIRGAWRLGEASRALLLKSRLLGEAPSPGDDLVVRRDVVFDAL